MPASGLQNLPRIRWSTLDVRQLLVLRADPWGDAGSPCGRFPVCEAPLAAMGMWTGCHTNKLVSVSVMEVLAGKGEMVETLFHFTMVPSDLLQMFNTHG